MSSVIPTRCISIKLKICFEGSLISLRRNQTKATRRSVRAVDLEVTNPIHFNNYARAIFFISNDAFGLFLISFSFSCVILNFFAAVETSTISFCMAVASYL